MKKKNKSRNETFVANDHQIAVKVWCASCQYKSLTRAVTLRRCTKHNKDVKPSGCCKSWEMSEQLQMAGASLGVVRDMKTKEVLF